jgi:hypothetical protein
MSHASSSDNTFMQIVRNARQLARLVLAWFVLALGAAVASPFVKPQNLLLICTGSGAMKVLVQTEDGSLDAAVSIGMDCPLCVSVGAPPPGARLNAELVLPLAHLPQTNPGAPIAALTAVPPPGRGPPTVS